MRHAPSRSWIIGRLFSTGLLNPRALTSLVRAWHVSGGNLVALARFGASSGRSNPMLIDEEERVAFSALADDAEQLAVLLRHAHGIVPRQSIGIMGENSVALVRALLAASRLGARAVLLNPHLPVDQIAQLLERHRIAVVLVPGGLADAAAYAGCVICDPTALLRADPIHQATLPKIRAGEITVLTGGTTGLPKAARRKVGATSVLRLFLHLIAALQLERRRSVYVAVPLFHGFGLAALVIAIALGRTVYLQRRFDAAMAAALLTREDIDMMAVVPTMLQRMLPHLAYASSLLCIVSGGAPLAPQLAIAVREQCGDLLFNLFGTSEAGLSALATPMDLAAAPDTIGRAVWGAAVSIRDPSGLPTVEGTIGELFVRNSASIAPRDWISTGDRASRDGQGRLYLHGRTDDVILSGGENVSPWEVESVLLAHPMVAEAAAVGVPDADFGQRLSVAVVLRDGCSLDVETLRDWLLPRIARHQVPREIVVQPSLPLTAIGKVDRRALVRAFS